MIQRRQFLSAAAGATAAAYGGWLSNTHAATWTAERNLNWYCDVVRTVDHTDSKRHPVVTGVALQRTGDMLAVVGDDHFVCIYDMAKHEFTQQARHHSDWIRTTAFSPAGNKLATGGNDRKLVICDMDDLQRPVIKKRHPGAIIDVDFANDGSKIATVGFERKLRIYDVEDGQQIAESNCPCADIRSVAFSRDNNLIAAGGRCGTIRVWEVESMKQVANFQHHRNRIRSVEFTSSGNVLSASEDQTVCITNPITSKIVTKTPRLPARLFSMALMGGGFLATGGSDNQIRIWQTSNFGLLGKLTGHTGTVSCLAAKENTLVSAGYDTTVRIWRTELDSSAQKAPDGMFRQSKSSDGWNPQLK